MNDVNPFLDDCISALADGALSGNARAQAMQSVLNGAQGLQTWHAYHVVGDVLRSDDLAQCSDDYAFWERLSQKIAMEPAHPVGELVTGVQDAVHVQVTGSPGQDTSANDSVWRWKLLAGVACAVLGGVFGLELSGLTSSPVNMADSGRLGVAPPDIATADSHNRVVLRDPQVDGLMAAHQQVSGHSALQAPSGFLRNATYEGIAR